MDESKQARVDKANNQQKQAVQKDKNNQSAVQQKSNSLPAANDSSQKIGRLSSQSSASNPPSIPSLKKIEKPQSHQFFIVHKPLSHLSSKPQKQVKDKQKPQPFDKILLAWDRKSSINFDEVSKMRIPSDDIICKQEDSESLTQSITCPICLMILQIPYYECQGCMNGFCTLCLESWWKKAPNSCAFKCSNVQFKQIKRSNTYNALVGMLKVKCQHCKNQYTISQISNHIIKNCPSVIQLCRFCNIKMARNLIQKHEKQQCEFRPQNCPHCQTDYRHCQKQRHEQFCEQKQQACSNQGCSQLIKRKNLQAHLEICDYKLKVCQWCSQSMLQKQYKIHHDVCDEKTAECIWCKKVFNFKESNEHEKNCELKKEGCRLCHEMVLVSSMNEHKIECMFTNLIEIKTKNQSLESQNIRLKQKIMMLQGIIQETIENNKLGAIKFVNDMRVQDKKSYEKDLQRLDNSIRSVEKLKKQQFTNHLRFPHLIQSWCPICKEMEKKFKNMLDPLLDQRKQVLSKISQIQRASLTPKPK